MEVDLTDEYLRALKPQPYVQDVELELQMQRLHFEGHSDLLRVCRLIVNPLRNFKAGSGAHEVAHPLFLKYRPRAVRTNSEVFASVVRAWGNVTLADSAKNFVLWSCAEGYTALPDVALGGCLVLRLAREFNDYASHYLLWRCFRHFRAVKIVKPAMSACCEDDGLFVVCEELLVGLENNEECTVSWQYYCVQQLNKFIVLRNQWLSGATKLCELIVRDKSVSVDAASLEMMCMRNKSSMDFAARFASSRGCTPLGSG